MKKFYETPELVVEKFQSDINTMADFSKSELNDARALYAGILADNGYTEEQAISEGFSFDAFLMQYYGYDNSLSKYCYMTTGDFS